MSLYNSRIDLIEKQFDFIIKSFTNIKLGGKITLQARRKEVRMEVDKARFKSVMVLHGDTQGRLAEALEML